MHRTRWLVLAPFIVTLLLSQRAEAHAHLVRADLAPDGHYRVSVGTVRFWFDEPLNSALSSVVILNAAGRSVNVDTSQINPGNDEELDVGVPTLPDGVYSVRWTSDSAQDGHITHGSYLFTVGGPGAVALGDAPAGIAGSDGAALDAGGVAVALTQWLSLIAMVIWTGALALELLVLAPERRRSHDAPRRLAVAGSGRVGVVMRLGLLATLISALLELATQAYAATGSWSGPGTTLALGDILGSPYGVWFGARLGLALLALLVVQNPNGAGRLPIGGHAATLGLVALRRPVVETRPLGMVSGRLLAVLGPTYLLALALSSHNAALPHMALTAVMLDWLHLIATSIWVGGMVAIALVLLPLRPWSRDLLDLLDRFSPAAFLALIAAAATGMFNAQVRIDSLATLFDTTYGRLLLIKLALIGVIAALSASHVFGTRPRLRAATTQTVATARAYASLIRRLRIEPLLGLGILLCAALMGQVAPSAAAFDATVLQVTGSGGGGVSGGPIAATGRLGDLAVTLHVNPADVGQAQFTSTVSERGRSVSDAQVRIKLAMPSTPDLGVTFVEMTPGGGDYSGAGDLVQEGLWTADVLVRTRSDPQQFRDVPFAFVASPEAAFLSGPSADTRYGPATVRLQSPAGAGATLDIHLRPGLQARYTITMPDMGPQQGALQAQPGGWYRGVLVPPMEGFMNLAIQVQRGSGWQTVRTLVCSVNGNYQMQVLR